MASLVNKPFPLNKYRFKLTRALFELRECEEPISHNEGNCGTPKLGNCGLCFGTSIMFSEEQAEAWKSDEMFRLLVSGSKEYAIILLDDQGDVVRWNDGAQQMYGLQSGEIIGQHVSKFYRDEDIKAGKPEVELRLARIAGRFQDEGWRLKKDGSTFWAAFELTALRDTDGTLTGFGKVVRDITARKYAEERLRKSEEMFRLLVLGVKDYAIVKLDPSGEVASWNEGAERIKGFRADEILGSNCSLFYTADDIALGKPDLELQIAARDGRLEIEGWRVRKDGLPFQAHVVITALNDESGRLVGFAEVTRDITGQKDAEHALTAAKEQAEQASKFKSEFLANMSHEIRTPMNGIIGITNILLRSPLAEKQRQNLSILKDVGTSLLTIINDILDFSKVEAGKMQLESMAFDPNVLVESIGDMFAHQARGANVTLSTYVAPTMPRLLKGDANRLRQILTNLTSNAIKFSGNGEVSINATFAVDRGAKVILRFDVSDTGVGIAPEAMDRIFAPFVQADGSTNRKYGGTGLGLSISKSLVELMGGTIGVKSQVGGGSTFWFTAPFELKDLNCRQIAPNLFDEKLKVLLIDDAVTSLKILESYLSAWGISYESTDNIEKALNMLSLGYSGKEPFAFALINLSSSLTQLIKIAPRLIEAAEKNSTQIVLAHGVSDAENEQELLDQYFPARISKPIKGSELFAFLEKYARLDFCKVADTDKDSQPIQSQLVPVNHLIDANKRVLVVEDNQVNTLVILTELEELGLRAEAVGNGAEALKAIAQSHYDVILMDCQMPEMDGFEASRLIREREAVIGGHIPIIALTAQVLDGDRQKCLAHGMDDYLSKPIDVHLLEKALLRLFNDSSRNGANAANLGLKALVAKQDELTLNQGACLVDLEYLHNKYSASRVNDLIRLFMDSSGALIDKIEESISNRESERLASTSHELAGSCMMLKMERMLSEARSLEAIGKDAKWENAAATLSELKKSYKATKEAVLPVIEQ